jgi:hypothetical protein
MKSWAIGATIFAAFITLFLVAITKLTPVPSVQHSSGRVFIVTIDSAATDSIYGKLWRNEK